MPRLFGLLFVVLLMGCGVGIKLTTIQTHPAVASYEPFVVIEENEPFDTARFPLVARLRTTDRGMSLRCNYPTVLDTVSSIARSLGANLVKIDRHLLPDAFGSTCHRVEVRMYRAEDATPFERMITWYPERRLRVADFMGDTVARPFRAASYCGITYHADQVGREVSIVVEALFDHHVSYFKRDSDDAEVLIHEQVHFDMAELYARMLRKRITGTSFAGVDATSRLRDMHTEAMRELAIEQDRYDAEVYADPTKQPSWSDSVRFRLAELAMYSSHTLTISTN